MSGIGCAVFGCKNSQLVKLSKSFFRFPRDKKVCDQWVINCERRDLDDIYKKEGPAYLYKTHRVCSDHFRPTDFRNPQLYSQGLKPNSVPTQNLPSSSASSILGPTRRSSRKRMRVEEVEQNETPTTSSVQEQPTDSRSMIWAKRESCLELLENGAEELNTNYRLCSDHFHDSADVSSERKRLHYYALPEIFADRSEEILTDQLCRTCACQAINLIPVFGDQGKEMQLVDKIHTHLPLLVTPDDLMPVAMCETCIIKLEMCQQFVEECVQADAKLRTILNLEDMPTGGYDDLSAEAALDDSQHKEYGGICSVEQEPQAEEEAQDAYPALVQESLSQQQLDLELNPPTLSEQEPEVQDDNRETQPQPTIKRRLWSEDGRIMTDSTKAYNKSPKSLRRELKTREKQYKSCFEVDERVEDPGGDVRIVETLSEGCQEEIEESSNYSGLEETQMDPQNVSYISQVAEMDVLSEESAEVQYLIPGNINVEEIHIKDEVKNADDSLEASELSAADGLQEQNQWDSVNVEKNRKKINGERKNKRFKVVVVKMKTSKELSSKEQLKKAINLLRKKDPDIADASVIVQNGIEYQSQNKSLRSTHGSNIDQLRANSMTSRNLSMLSDEDAKITKKICLAPKISFDEKSIRLEQNNEEINQTVNEEKDLKKYHCKYCLSSVVGKESFARHQEMYHPDKIFSVSYVNTTHDSKQGLEENSRNNTDINELNLNCSEYIKENCKSGSNEIPSEILKSTSISVCENKETPVKDAEMEILSMSEVRIEALESQMKISKDFEKIDKNLKAKIIGSIKNIMKSSDRSRARQSNRKRSEIARSNWVCKKCKHVSLSWREYIVHARSHPYLFNCSRCDKQFSSKARLLVHKSVHAKEKQCLCEYCGKSFVRKSRFACHLMLHRKGGTEFKCAKCGKVYATKNGFDCHQVSHREEAQYLCTLCGKKLKYASSLRIHMIMHKDPALLKKYHCEICGKKWVNRYLLKEHMNVHKDIRPFNCPHCPKSFHKKGLLNQHLVVHTGVLKYKCTYCGKAFKRQDNMAVHARRHLFETKYSCRICKIEFKTRGSLLSHRRTHTSEEVSEMMENCNSLGEKPPVYTCDICGKCLSTKRTLRYHKLTHSSNKAFKCENCGREFVEERKFESHKLTHSTEKPFTCQYCSKGFSIKRYLIIHGRLHTGDAPFQCTECNKAFRSKMSLTQHMSVHSEDRPFSCQQCGRGFRRRDTLTLHMRTHTGERPYSCNICHRRFKQKGDCNKHVKSHFKSNKTSAHEQSYNQTDELNTGIEQAHSSSVVVVSENQVENSETLVLLPQIIESAHNTVIVSNAASSIDTSFIYRPDQRTV